MTTSYRRLVLHPFVVLLMLVAMVFVTAADAAACGAEVAPGSTPVLASLDSASASSAAADARRALIKPIPGLIFKRTNPLPSISAVTLAIFPSRLYVSRWRATWVQAVRRLGSQHVARRSHSEGHSEGDLTHGLAPQRTHRRHTSDRARSVPPVEASNVICIGFLSET